MATAMAAPGAAGTAAGTPAATTPAPAGTRTRARAHSAARAAPGTAGGGGATADLPARRLTFGHQPRTAYALRRPGWPGPRLAHGKHREDEREEGCPRGGPRLGAS